MNTWRGEKPPELPPPSVHGRLVGFVRLVALIAVTGVLFPLFLCGQLLRHWLGHGVTFHFAIAGAWSRLTLKLCGLRHIVRGRPVHAGALVANHSSWLDIPTLRAVKLMYFVSKAEVRDWPIVGYITHACGTIFIERRRSHAKHQEQALRERIAGEQLLLFFPEGTSTDGLRVLSFKSSLFSVFFRDQEGADLLVQPVTVRYIPAPDSGLPPNFYGWWGDMDFGSHVWAVLSRSFGGRAEVIFHDPVKPHDFPDRKTLAEHCQAAVAEGHRAAPVHAGSIRAGGPDRRSRLPLASLSPAHAMLSFINNVNRASQAPHE